MSIGQDIIQVAAAAFATTPTVVGNANGNMLSVYSTLDAPVYIELPVTADNRTSGPQGLAIFPGASFWIPVGVAVGQIKVYRMSSPVPTVGVLWMQSWNAV